MKEFLYEINQLEVIWNDSKPSFFRQTHTFCRGCFIIVKIQRSGSRPWVVFYVFILGSPIEVASDWEQIFFVKTQ